MSNENNSIPAPVGPVVGPVLVVLKAWKLPLLPIMLAIELISIFAVLCIGIIRPSLGLKLTDWLSRNLPDPDWYWGMKRDVPSRPNPKADRAGASEGDPNAITK